MLAFYFTTDVFPILGMRNKFWLSEIHWGNVDFIWSSILFDTALSWLCDWNVLYRKRDRETWGSGTSGTPKSECDKIWLENLEKEWKPVLQVGCWLSLWVSLTMGRWWWLKQIFCNGHLISYERMILRYRLETKTRRCRFNSLFYDSSSVQCV